MKEDIEGPVPVMLDSTAADLPEQVAVAYREMNDAITSDLGRYESLTQVGHLESSRTMISRTAGMALRRVPAGEVRRAVLLGAGGCNDIPLEEIVTEFDRTTLVDAETTHTERALSNLPVSLLGKVSLTKADLSGSVARLASSVHVTGLAQDYSAFIKTASAAVRGIAEDQRRPNIGGDYAFVCSQLVMSQLSSIPVLYVRKYMAGRYGQQLTMRPGAADEELVYAINQLNRVVQVGHIASLAELVKPTGTVHFADTVAEVVRGPQLPMTTRGILGEVDRRFSNLGEMKDWDYRPSPTRLFHVIAYALEPKRD